MDDLISSGVIGLMEAAGRFDPKRVDRFEAFAEFRIRGAMLDDLRSRDTLSATCAGFPMSCVKRPGGWSRSLAAHRTTWSWLRRWG